MTLVELVTQQRARSRRDIVLVAGLSALANAGLLAVINHAIHTPPAAEAVRVPLLFVIAFALYVVCFRKTFHAITALLEDVVARLRGRIAEAIRRAELATIERVDRARVLNVLTAEATVVSESSGALAAALQAGILVTFAGAYLAWLSAPAFLFCAVLVGAGVPAYVRRLRQAAAWRRRAFGEEVRCFATFRDLLDGFKELRLHERRGAALMTDVHETARTLADMRIRMADTFNGNYLVVHGSFYLTIAAVIFLLPKVVTVADADRIRVMLTVLFVLGPVGIVINGVQALAKADAAVHAITTLEAELARLPEAPAPEPRMPAPAGFTEIRMVDVTFRHVDRDGQEVFRVGPLDLAIRRGEIVFVMGGNGSGKTTFLKLLTALYPPAGGRLLVDDVAIGPAGWADHRARFSAVFADAHLFPTLYGLEGVADEHVRRLLRDFELDGKTDFVGGRFTSVELSAGQRKRLALIVALLENRPIHVFDEWAADQDPAFRRYFYEELLPDLVARGKTIVAVTHDDRYLHVAHRVIMMELGRVERIVEAAR